MTSIHLCPSWETGPHVSLRFLPSSPVKGFSSLTLVEGSEQRMSHLVSLKRHRGYDLSLTSIGVCMNGTKGVIDV